MFYIVALGNPGTEYKQTRHNVGWLVADALRTHLNFSEPISSSALSGKICQGNIEGKEVQLLYPETFMNNSGSAVTKLLPKVEVEQLIVLHDEVALPLGEIKLSVKKGDGGHNGIKSIIEKVGSRDFVRVRIGIAPTSFWTGKTKLVTGDKLARFVLGKFTSSEVKKLQDIEKLVVQVVQSVIKDGVVGAMNRFN
jgi:peptidyl-tRNA hydrolase, PTH1 family